MLIFVGSYVVLCSYWLTVIAEKLEARKSRRKERQNENRE